MIFSDWREVATIEESEMTRNPVIECLLDLKMSSFKHGYVFPNYSKFYLRLHQKFRLRKYMKKCKYLSANLSVCVCYFFFLPYSFIWLLGPFECYM